MKEYTFEEIELGLTASFSKIITEEDMASFLRLTGDLNPLHNDEKYAKSHNFKGRVVYGMLISSLLSTLAGVYLPGKNSLILSVDTNFVKPSFIGDNIKIKGEVVDKKDFANLIKVLYSITNQNEEVISKGNMIVKVRDKNE